MEQLLELRDVHTYYGESHVLHGVSLEMAEDSVVALLGRNGMGKTTTIHSIIGITPPRQGSILYKGREVTSLQGYKIPRVGIALVPQGRRIFPFLSVKENLFPVLKERSSFRGNLLSGGEQQMLAIGRALMTNPDLLLMDEPSEGLAPLVVRNLTMIIDQLHQTGLSILLVEQNLNMALAVADYTYILNKGRVIYESLPADLKQNEEVVSTYLGVAA
jgi:branched-chain amino acid transport system ATP-binding protein